MTEHVVRLLTAEDVNHYRELLLRSLEEEPTAFLHDHRDASQWPIERFTKQLQESWTAGAWDGAMLVGIAALHRYKGAKVQHKAMIGPVYVAPEARGHNLAATMMTMLENRAKEVGVELIMLSTNAKNDLTLNLYKRLGYESWGVEKHILKMEDGSYIDDVFMGKPLI